MCVLGSLRDRRVLTFRRTFSAAPRVPTPVFCISPDFWGGRPKMPRVKCADVNEAIQREVADHCFPGEGGVRLETCKTPGVRGLGVRYSSRGQGSKTALEMPTEGRRVLLRWEGDWCETEEEAEKKIKNKKDVNEIIEIRATGTELTHGFIVPTRCPAQLVRCAHLVLDDEDNPTPTFDNDGNCMMELIETEDGRPWMGLVQTRTLQASEELRYLYSSNDNTELMSNAIDWSRAAKQREREEAEKVSPKRPLRDPITGLFTKRPKNKISGKFLNKSEM